MKVGEFVFVRGDSCETFCRSCGQLRLWAKPEKPEACGNCQSPDIVIGPLLGDELPKLRAEWQRERWVEVRRDYALGDNAPVVVIPLTQETVLRGQTK